MTGESTFERLYRLFDEADGLAMKKTRFRDLQLYKRGRKQQWKTLGATPEQVKRLKSWEKA